MNVEGPLVVGVRQFGFFLYFLLIFFLFFPLNEFEFVQNNFLFWLYRLLPFLLILLHIELYCLKLSNLGELILYVFLAVLFVQISLDDAEVGL